MQLRIADDIVHTIGALHQLSRVIARQDPDLRKQMRRALTQLRRPQLRRGALRSRRQSHRAPRERHGERLSTPGSRPSLMAAFV